MSQNKQCENLLINYCAEPSDVDQNKSKYEGDISSTKRVLNEILCSTQPLYKLLSKSNDADDNNPFDHFDKQARLSDDPFEIVEKAAFITSDMVATVGEVKTAILISFDLNLNAADSVSSSEENECVNGAQKEEKFELRHDSGSDDSFDDIWSTTPNLIDSEIDVESDLDYDIAKLNIPMLKIFVPNSPCKDIASFDPIDSETKESIQSKTLNRNSILEKFASIKQKIPQSSAICSKSAVSTSSSSLPLPLPFSTIPIHKHTTRNIGNSTPSTQCSQIELQHHQQPTMPDNPDWFINNLRQLIDQCDDKLEQNTAKHLLDDLSSILTKKKVQEKNINVLQTNGHDQPTKMSIETVNPTLIVVPPPSKISSMLKKCPLAAKRMHAKSNMSQIIRRRPIHGIMKTPSIMKKSTVPPTACSSKIRASQSTTGRLTAPLRAVVPMKQKASLHLMNNTAEQRQRIESEYRSQVNSTRFTAKKLVG